MVNTEHNLKKMTSEEYYNILNIVVNTELSDFASFLVIYYNILNIVVNTELPDDLREKGGNYNILNIVVNTELPFLLTVF